MEKKLAAAMATADQARTTTNFPALLRAYEQACASGTDTTNTLYALATACALSVLKKCVDPQRKTAEIRESVSNSGLSPALTAVRRDVLADLDLLEKLTAAHNAAYALEYNQNGDFVQVVVDKAAEKAAAALQSETLGDGLDLVNAAVVAILEQTAEHYTDTIDVAELDERSYTIVHSAWIAAGGGVRKENRTKEEYARLCQLSDLEHELDEGINFHGWSIDNVNKRLIAADLRPVTLWIEEPYTIRRPSRRVVIKEADSAKWEDVNTSPIREVYRAVRREVQNSRAMQTDPRNGYLYIEDTIADPDSDKTETIYRRLHKWADLGGYTHTGDYTADTQTAIDYEAVLAALNLTDRQAQIVRLRMSGYGYKAIATYLGLRYDNVKLTIKRIREKCENIGFSPAMWAEMNTEK